MNRVEPCQKDQSVGAAGVGLLERAKRLVRHARPHVDGGDVERRDVARSPAATQLLDQGERLGPATSPSIGVAERREIDRDPAGGGNRLLQRPIASSGRCSCSSESPAGARGVAGQGGDPGR
jgi:hypothetical protein